MTTSVEIPFRALVNKADPDHEKKKRRELEYKFSNNREFRANPAIRGPYAPAEE